MDSFEPEPLEHQPAAKGVKPRHVSRAVLIRMLGLVVGVAIILVVPTWYLIVRHSRTSGSFHLGPVQVFNANCSYDDASLCKFLNNWPNQKTYAITSTSTNMAGQTVVTTFELSGDDKTLLSTTTAGKSTADLITIGNTSYTKDYTDGKWWQQTSTTAAQPATEKSFQFNTNPDANHPDTKPSYHFVSQGKCGDSSGNDSGSSQPSNCLKYQISFVGESYQEYIWFDTSDYLLRQSTIQLDSGPITTLRYTYSGINIVAPSPTKKLPAGQISG